MTKHRPTVPKTVRDRVLKEFKHRCAKCGADDPQVHHIDENPSNNDPLNLIPLCPNCHLNWYHTLSSQVDAHQLSLFRRYRNPSILAPQFRPLLQRLRFLDDVRDNSDVHDLHASVAELVGLVRMQVKGEFYAGRIKQLLAFEQFSASVSIPFGGTVPQWYVDGKNNEAPRYRQKVRSVREQVYALVVELLVYQDWPPT